MQYIKEIYFTKNNISKETWIKFLNTINKYNSYFKKWQLIISINNNQMKYYLKTSFNIPSSINNLDEYLLKSTSNINIPNYFISLPIHIPIGYNLFDIINFCKIKNLGNLKYLTITFHKIKDDKYLSTTSIYTLYKDKLIKSNIFLSTPSTILNISYSSNIIYSYPKLPKYLDITKILHLLKSDKTNSILKIDTFPYLEDEYYLDQNNIDFAKHSFILGSSGSGKSKFISSFINNLQKNNQEKYKVILIDPHASIEKDIGNLGKIINFNTIEESINLFASTSQNIISTTELTLELFKNLISDQYNSKLERVLRHSIYLLITSNKFNFINLKNLITEPSYRNSLIKQYQKQLPINIINFFLNDFNDLKTRSYNEAISPIISFIDEMSLLPVFNYDNIPSNLQDTINNNFLSIFSLNKTILGDKITKTIASLIMQQLFIIIQNNSIKEHIIFIVDEVSVIENPILCHFLSEARKYNLSLILVSQYFNQISPNLKESIFANVINYYIFRISRLDASLLADNLNIKIPNINDPKILKEEKINLLSSLNNRECLIRLSSNNILLPSFKAKTLDFNNTNIHKTKKSNKTFTQEILSNNKISLSIGNIDLNNILKETSTSRKVI